MDPYRPFFPSVYELSWYVTRALTSGDAKVLAVNDQRSTTHSDGTEREVSQNNTNNIDNTSNFSGAFVLPAATGGLPAGTKVLAAPDVAEHMGVVVTKIFDMLRNRQLLAVRHEGVRYIPARFFHDTGELNKFVPGVIALLGDGGYHNEEILEFLYTEDDSLPGRPVDALHGHLAREVMRRAQAMAIL